MTTITVTFDPPLPSDSPATFNSKAFDTLGDLNTWSGQANTVAGEVNTNATNAATSAGTASTHASTATTKAGEANASAVAAAASASSASTSAGTATTKASEADASAIAAAASAASIAPGSLLTAANPSYTGTLTGGTGVVNLGSGQFVKDASGNVGLNTTPSYLFDARSASSIVARLQSTTSGAYLSFLDNGGVNGYVRIGAVNNDLVLMSGGNINGTLNAAGNLSLGAPSSTWGSDWRALQFGSNGALWGRKTSTGSVFLSNNLHYDGATFRFLNAGAGSFFAMATDGACTWVKSTDAVPVAGGAVSGTVTNMALDLSGNLAVPGAMYSSSRGVAAGFLTPDWRMYNTSSDNALAWNNGSDRMTLDVSGNLTPGADNTQTNGSGAKRWSTIYAGTGTINTSDAREKTDVRVMAADEIEAAKALSKEIGVYQFLDSVAAKGDKARHHIGMTVQRAIEIMKHHGLDPFSYGFICYDKWDEETKDHPAVEAREAVEAKDAVLDDEGNVVEPAVEAQPAIEAKDAWTEVTLKAGDRYSFRYDQLTLFIARGLHAEIEAMQTQLDAQNTAMQMLATRLAALEAA